jgi:hypothetical protein
VTRSRLVTQGQETIDIYPEVKVENNRGEVYKTPSQFPVTVRCTVAEERQSSAELAGQVDVKIVRIICRNVAGTGAQSRVVFRGEEWDLAEPPHFSTGASRAMRHMELLLRSRNKLGDTV